MESSTTYLQPGLTRPALPLAPDITPLLMGKEQLSHNAELQALQSIYSEDYPWLVDLADQPAAATAVQTAMERSVLVGVSDPSHTSQT